MPQPTSKSPLTRDSSARTIKAAPAYTSTKPVTQSRLIRKNTKSSLALNKATAMRSSTPQLRDTSRNPIAKAPNREQDYQTIVREEIPAAHNPYEYPHEALLTFQDENNIKDFSLKPSKILPKPKEN